MRTLIAYATKYGGTKTCAERLRQTLPGGADLLALPAEGHTDPTAYDTVIVGCSVYMGKPRKEAMAFCKEHKEILLTKNLGLFLCCMQDLDKTVKQQMALAFPQDLRKHAAALGALGGVVDYGKLSRVDGFIMKLVAGDLMKKAGQSMLSTLSQERIDAFVSMLFRER
ncbi:MAG: flavodoxin domain-containing protein [Firmicutes bacterium]|nr:flavodoxin domain-containing protein [Bacillota bacterium]